MEEERDKGKTKERKENEERKKETNKQTKAVPSVKYYVRHFPCSSPRSEEG
jgi:hypothetical protein